MLKALTEQGILWLTQVGQGARNISKTLGDGQTGEHEQTAEKYHSLICQEMFMSNALKKMPRNSVGCHTTNQIFTLKPIFKKS